MNGWLNLDKPLGMTSAQAVNRVKRLLRPEKIGHAGTLDPLASGILPLALGEATKTVAYMMDAVKAYRFTITFGESRETDDAEGAVTATSPVYPEMSAIKAVLPRFLGHIQQTPPAYSALKVDGKRAYALARAGEEVVLQPRAVYIQALELLEVTPQTATFTVTCGKGTYVRSLGRDIAHALGALGYISMLRRTRVGPFGEPGAISLENLEKMVHNHAHQTVLHPVESALDDIPAREVDSARAALLRHGQTIRLSPAEQPADQDLVRVRCQNALVALCSVHAGMMKPVRVFNLLS